MDWKIGTEEGNPEAIQMTDLGFGSLGLGQQPIFDPDTAFPPLHRSVILF
jgi:hypothetical protein